MSTQKKVAFTLLAIGLAFMATLANAQRLEDGRFWKPSASEQGKHWRAIGAQQAQYEWAKNSGDVDSAMDAALWPYQIAWLAQNEGIRLQKKGYAKKDIGSLQMAALWFDEAIEQAAAEEVHNGQAKDCTTKARRCLKATRRAIEDMREAESRKARRRNYD